MTTTSERIRAYVALYLPIYGSHDENLQAQAHTRSCKEVR